MMETPNNFPVISVSVIVTQKNDFPAIELRRVTTDFQIIKIVISSAFHQRPILILPQFKDKLQSLNSLVDKGILYRDKEQFFFTL